jgi:hypothetical protein
MQQGVRNVQEASASMSRCILRACDACRWHSAEVAEVAEAGAQGIGWHGSHCRQHCCNASSW